MRSGHLPVEIVRRDLDLRVLSESARRGFHNCERLRKYLVQSRFDVLIDFLDEFVRLCRKRLFLLNRKVSVKLDFYFIDSLLVIGDARSHEILEFVSLRPEFIVRQLVDIFVCSKNLVEKRLYLFHVTLGLGSEKFFENVC